MTTLRDFMTNRESDIKAQIKALRGELADLKLAKSALDSSESATSTNKSATANTKTIKEMVRDVLKSAHTGLTSTEILTEINTPPDQHVERTSLSPQLSRMKEQGEVKLIDNMWFLTDGPDFDFADKNENAERTTNNESFSDTLTQQGQERYEEEYDPDIPF
tara:strand:- start:69 stop:554 length:486 start_codon:yes stop_codon:yes gene_type:complete